MWEAGVHTVSRENDRAQTLHWGYNAGIQHKRYIVMVKAGWDWEMNILHHLRWQKLLTQVQALTVKSCGGACICSRPASSGEVLL